MVTLERGSDRRSTAASTRPIGVRCRRYTSFIQQEPDEGEPATERTEIRFLLDRRNLYIAVICYDPDAGRNPRQPEPPRCRSRRHRLDPILLDTFNDGQNAFVFGTNPFGIEYDGQVMAEGQTGQRAAAAAAVEAST